MSDNKLIQSVIITFSDGKKATFSGQVAATENDTRTISGIHFTLPVELPKDCSWSNIDDL